MFKITGGRGFHITFANGYTVSVQFGLGSYSDNHDARIIGVNDLNDLDLKLGAKGSSLAECAVWPKGGEMIEYGDWGDTEGGYMSPDEVLKLMNWAASQEARS